MNRIHHALLLSSLTCAAVFGFGPGRVSTAQAQAVVLAPTVVGKASVIELKPAIVAFSDKVTLRAAVAVVDGTKRTPVADGDVEFKLGGYSCGTAKTDASGIATLTIQTNKSPLESPLKTTARFAGKGNVLAATTDSTLAIIKSATKWSPAAGEELASEVRLKAWLEGGVGPTAKVNIQVNGKAVKTVDNWLGTVNTLPYSTFAVGQNKVRLEFDGNEYYSPAATEFTFVRKQDTNLYFDPTTPSVAPFGKTMTIRVRVGTGLSDSPNAAMFVPAAGVGVLLVEEHPQYVTSAKIAYTKIEHAAVTDGAGWATLVTSADWNSVKSTSGATSGRQFEHRLSISVKDATRRADPKPGHVRTLTVKM